MLLGRARVVARDQRHVHDLLEAVAPGLARLELDDVQDLLAPVEHEIVEAQQDARALGIRRRAPRTLRLAPPLDRGGDVAGGAARHRRERLPRRGILDLDRLALTVAHADQTGQAGDALVLLQLWTLHRACHWTSKRIWKKSSISGTGSSAWPT